MNDDAPTDFAAYDALGDLYDVWTSQVVEDLPLYSAIAEALTREVGHDQLRILELGAGTGRVAVPLASAGHHVTALDASADQLQRLRARERVLSRIGAPPISTVVGDMRDLAAVIDDEPFDLVLAPFRGLLHVADDRDALLAQVFARLVPGGALAFDVFHPRLTTVAASTGHWMHRCNAPTEHGRWRFDERAHYRKAGTQLELDIRARWSRRPIKRARRDRSAPADTPSNVVSIEPAEGEPRERRAHMILSTPPADAWRASLLAAGFELDAVYGWFDGVPFDPDEDDDSIWVARRVR